MIQGQSHGKLFSRETLPSLFFGDPARVSTHLSQHGNRFLEVAWQSAGKGLAPESVASPVGLDHEVRESHGGRVVSVTLPVPGMSDDVYFVALVQLRGQQLRVYTLDKTPGGAALVSEQTQSGTRRCVGRLEDPNRQGFLDCVELEIKNIASTASTSSTSLEGQEPKPATSAPTSPRSKPSYYQASGVVPIKGLALALIACPIAALVIGATYSFGINLIPVVHANILFTLFCGAAIGFVAKKSALFGRIRNRKVPMIIGITCSLIGLWMAWVTDPVARLEQPFAFSPAVLFAYISEFYENGYWTLFDSNAPPFSGILLGLVWLGEAALVILLAKITAGSSDAVYCESCDQWAEETQGVRLLDPGSDAVSGVRRGRLTRLHETAESAGDSGLEDQEHVRVDVSKCPSCQNSNYLSLRQVTMTEKGKRKPGTNPIVTNLRILEDDARQLLQAR